MRVQAKPRATHPARLPPPFAPLSLSDFLRVLPLNWTPTVQFVRTETETRRGTRSGIPTANREGKQQRERRGRRTGRRDSQTFSWRRARARPRGADRERKQNHFLNYGTGGSRRKEKGTTVRQISRWQRRSIPGWNRDKPGEFTLRRHSDRTIRSPSNR